MLSRLVRRSARTSVSWTIGPFERSSSTPDVLPYPNAALLSKKIEDNVALGLSRVTGRKELDDAERRIEGSDTEGDEYDEDEEEGVRGANEEGMDEKTREHYILREERKRLVAEGAAPVSVRALDSLERHLLSRSSIRGSLAPLSISLFNFHTTSFAQRLLDRSIGSLVLVESAHEHSIKAKEFARSSNKRGLTVSALHADPSSLFGLDRRKAVPTSGRKTTKTRKPPSFSFPDQLIARPREDEGGAGLIPLRLRRRGTRPPTTTVSPIVVCPLASQTQQTAVLSTILRSLLQHHTGRDTKGIYSLGDVEHILYLHAEQTAHLLSATSPAFSFLSHAIRRQSLLMNRLFVINRLDYALAATSFSPPNIPPSKISHAKKLKEIGYTTKRWFACSIQPRSTVVIGDREVVGGEAEEEDNERIREVSPSSCLSPSTLSIYSYWCNAIGAQPNTKKAGDVFGNLIPSTSSSLESIIPSTRKIGEATNEEIDAVFVEALPELIQDTRVTVYESTHVDKTKDKMTYAD